MNCPKTKIGILLAGFIEWGGGIDFIRYILFGIEQEKYECFFFIPRKNNFKISIKNKIKYFLNTYLSKKYKIEKIKSEAEILSELKDLIQNRPCYFYDSNRELEKISKKESVQVLIPSFYSLGKNMSIPWVGYIYDFQHKYLTHLFSKNEITSRDIQFQQTFQDSKKLIVNAQQVKSDIEIFLGKSDKVEVLPFTPKFEERLFKNILPKESILEKWNLSENYFLISNQFWSHKAHIVAFKAFHLLKAKFPNSDIKLVCTGEMVDDRDNTYIETLTQYLTENKLEQLIVLTGFISKQEQFSLINYAKAIIQPTNFEGGPGGGITYEALGLGVPCIISDIIVNKEIQHNLVTFFKVNDVDDLVLKMMEVLHSKKVEFNAAILQQNFKTSQNDLKQKINFILLSMLDNNLKYNT